MGGSDCPAKADSPASSCKAWPDCATTTLPSRTIKKKPLLSGAGAAAPNCCSRLTGTVSGVGVSIALKKPGAVPKARAGLGVPPGLVGTKPVCPAGTVISRPSAPARVISPVRVEANNELSQLWSLTSAAGGLSDASARPQAKSNTVPRMPMVAVLVWNFTCPGAALAISPVATRKPPLRRLNNMEPRAGWAASKLYWVSATWVPLFSVRRVSSRKANTA